MSKGHGACNAHPHYTPQVVDRLRQLHGRGLHDVAIAREMAEQLYPPTAEGKRRSVCDIRRRLKLPINRGAIHEAQLRGLASQRKTLGIRHGGDLRALAYRNFAAENGWPPDLRPRHVMILNLLMERGPMERFEIARAIGWNMDRYQRDVERLGHEGAQRHVLASNDPEGSYLAHLIGRGLLTSMRRARPGMRRGKARLPNLYLPTGAAISLREDALAARSKGAVS